jgi:hypothetical protein
VWVDRYPKGEPQFCNAPFWCDVKVEGKWYTSERVLLKVKGAINEEKPKP